MRPARLCATQSASGDPLEAERARRRFAGGDLDQCAQAGFIRAVRKWIASCQPPVIALEGGAGSVLRIEGFAEIAGEPPGGRFVAGQAGDGGGMRSCGVQFALRM